MSPFNPPEGTSRLLAPPLTASDTRPDDPAPGTYLTDGARLFHVERRLAGGSGEELLEIEDCRTLDLVLWESSAIRRMGLVTVR